MNKYLIAGFFCLVAALSGCSSLFDDDGVFRDRQSDYLQANEAPELSIPSNLDANAIQDYYVVPLVQRPVSSQTKYKVPRPMPLVGAENDELVKIKSFREDQWILVGMVAGEVWPRLREYLLGLGIGVEAEDGQAGELYTGWLLTSVDAEVREKFKFEVSQGLQRNSAEVRITHFEQDRSVVDPAFTWPTTSIKPEREKAMVQGFAQFVAESAEVGASVSLKAQDINTRSRLYLESQNGQVRVMAELAGDLAWASLSGALKKANFIVQSTHADEGYYTTTYEPPKQEKGGFWQRITGRGESQIKSGNYRVYIQAVGDGWSAISIKSEAPIKIELQERLLNEIKGHLT